MWSGVLTIEQVISCLDGKIRFWIFRFFHKDLSAINLFLDFLFLSQKRIRVISRNNPILDFTKEMHPKINVRLYETALNLFVHRFIFV